MPILDELPNIMTSLRQRLRELMSTSVERGSRGALLAATRKVVFWILVSAAMIVAFATIMIVVVALMNSEFRSRTQEHIMISDPNASRPTEPPPLTLRLELKSFDEETGRVRATALVWTSDSHYRKLLQEESLNLYLVVTDGRESRTAMNLVQSKLTFAPNTIPNIAFGYATSNLVDFSPVSPVDVSIFPFDAYQVRLFLFLTTREKFTPPYNVEVVRSYAGRMLAVQGNASEIIIRAEKPLLEKVVVVSASLLFVALCVVVGSTLWMSNEPLSGFQESLALAVVLSRGGGDSRIRRVPGSSESRFSGRGVVYFIVNCAPCSFPHSSC